MAEKKKQTMGEKKKQTKAGDKPWEKMNSGKKTSSDPKTANPKAAAKKAKPQYMDFLYLLPKKTGAKDLAGALGFVDKKQLEVWEDECVLEITTGEGTITFEDIRESLGKEDKEVLNDLRMKQVIACDYVSADSQLVKKIMQAFLKAFGGKIGSDTADFSPFLEVEEL